MKAPFYNQAGEKTKEGLLPKEIFDQPAKSELIHQVVVAQQANQRIATASTKDRSEVSGGGRKPWRQKGTGRARHGSIRSPIWVGGGVTFGPNNQRNYKQKINRVMARKALLGVLSAKAKDGQVILIEDLKLKEIKTKLVAETFNKLPLNGRSLIIVGLAEKEMRQAGRNIDRAAVIPADQLTALKAVSCRHLILSQSGLSELKAHLS
mgnify:CR=1 FL=1